MNRTSDKELFLHHTQEAIDHLAVAYRIVDNATIPYVADMLFDAMCVIDEAFKDVSIKGLGDE
jgi:hypothetical protein